MKRTMLAVILFSLTLAANAQDEEEAEKGGFKKENLFTGGNVIVSFYTGGTVLGASPHLGYSISKWLDAGVSLNYIYTGETDRFNNKFRQSSFGPGTFVRIFPIQLFFLQAQYEHNFQHVKYIPQGGGSYKIKDDVNSLLLGAGISSGKAPGNNTYYYFSVMFDALKLPNSPYVDSYGRLIPVIRAGFNIGLFQGRNRNR
jgi:hypothetical protein